MLNVECFKMDKFVIRLKRKEEKNENLHVPNKKSGDSGVKEDLSHEKQPSPSAQNRQSVSLSESELSDENLNNVTNETSTNQVKRKRYHQKFRAMWKEKYDFIVEKNHNTYCKVCNIQLKGGIFHIKRHSQSNVHLKLISAAKHTPKITEAGCFQEKRSHDPVKRAEMIFIAFIAEHNLPFRLMDHLPLMCSFALPDSKIAKKIKMKRKKCTQLALTTLGPLGKEQVVMSLKQGPFSIIIDETTDLSMKKSLAVVARYFKNDKVFDSFLDLIEVENANSESLYLSIKKILDENGIPYSNLVGLAADNANVMLGNKKSVQTHLKQNINPNLVVLGCTCHSFSLCSSYACKVLPENLENFVHNVCNYFSKSSKRTEDLKEFQNFCEETPTRILKLSSTRWLSLHMVIVRILKHWNSLTLFFQNEVLNEKIESARFILNHFHDKIIKCYMLFLSYILEVVNKLNIEFQSEKPKITKLVQKVTDTYKVILSSFIKKNVISRNDDSIMKLEMADPSNFMEIESMYFGAKLEVYLVENKDIDIKMLQIFRRRALDFYIELCKQIKSRFDLSNETLKFVSHFEPKNVTSGDIRSIAKVKLIFPDLTFDLEEINSEWQLAGIVGKKFEDLDVEQFWAKLCNTKNELNEIMFPHLKCLIQRILALPHSSAAAERIFSALSLIKVKTRNQLLIKTVCAMLHIKNLLRGNCCYSFEPDPKLINYNNSLLLDTEVLEEDVTINC